MDVHCLGERLESVRHHHHDSIASDSTQGLKHRGGVLGVQRAGRFVNEEDRAFGQQCTSKGDTLALAARQTLSAFAEHSLQAVRECIEVG